MTTSGQLDQWKDQGLISPKQYSLLSGLTRHQPLSLFLELNILLYAGILAFMAGLGWTVSTWSQQLGDLVVITGLSVLLVGCFWYCFSRSPAWSTEQTSSPNLAFDYVLYLGSLVWSLELTYIEERLHVLSQQRDLYLLATALLFFFLAYRFDNRLVLSLALTALAGWFGLTLSRWPSTSDAVYRQYAILYSVVVGAAAIALKFRHVKAHFFDTYLNVAATVLFWAILSGVFQHEGYAIWLFCLLVACAASCAWGLKQSQFSFVAYAAVYGYIGVSSILVRNINDGSAVFGYFFMTGIFMIIGLVLIARSFGREA